jgi:recombination protein RecR
MRGSLPALDRLVRALVALPTIGERSATRLAFHLLSKSPETARQLAHALLEGVDKVRECLECNGLAETDLCRICGDSTRDSKIMFVVEKPMDMLAIERLGEYRGVYYVLKALWAPLKGVTQEALNLPRLIDRARRLNVQEVIIGTGATVEGDATALIIAQQLQDECGIKCSRIGQGLPKGGELEFADDLTLSRALTGRLVFR